MKKQLSLLTLAALVASPVFAEPTLYGKANVSLQHADDGNESTLELVSNASRLGVKGAQKVEDSGIEVFYQAEFQVHMDDGEDKSGETFSQRNIFVGVRGDFGAVQAGKFDTPLKVAQKKIDLFNDLEGDIKAVVTNSDNRENDIVQYTTPAFGAVKVKVALIASEDEDVDNGLSSSITYEQDGWYLAGAYDSSVEAENTDVIRLVAQYSFDAFQFGALYEMEDADGEDSRDAALISAKYKMNKWAFKAQYGSSDIKEEGGSTFSIGADYKLAKSIKYFGYLTQNESDEGADDSFIGIGLEYKF